MSTSSPMLSSRHMTRENQLLHHELRIQVAIAKTSCRWGVWVIKFRPTVRVDILLRMHDPCMVIHLWMVGCLEHKIEAFWSSSLLAVRVSVFLVQAPRRNIGMGRTSKRTWTRTWGNLTQWFLQRFSNLSGSHEFDSQPGTKFQNLPTSPQATDLHYGRRFHFWMSTLQKQIPILA